MKLPHQRERALIAAAVTGDADACWRVLASAGELDWTWMFERLQELALAARFWAEAVRAGFLGSIPGPVRDRLTEAAQEAAARSARLVHMMAKAGAALDASGVRWLPMKGGALAFVAPAYHDTRFMSDIDVLVHPDDLVRAAQILRSLFPNTWTAGDYGAGDVAVAMRDGHSLYGFRDDDGALLELHHAFPGLRSRELVEDVFGRASTISTRGHTALVPALDDLLGTACVHVLEHHRRERKRVLRHLADVAELMRLGASDSVAAQRYDRSGCTPVADSMKLFAGAREGALAGGATGSRVLAAVYPSVWGKLGDRVGAMLARVARAIAGVRTFGRRAVVPPREFMVQMYGPAASGMRLPLLHLHRWGAVILRAIRGR